MNLAGGLAGGLIAVALLANGFLDRAASARHQAAVATEQRCDRLFRSFPPTLWEGLVLGRPYQSGFEVIALVGAEALTGVRLAECAPSFAASVPDDWRQSYKEEAARRNVIPTGAEGTAWRAWLYSDKAPRCRDPDNTTGYIREMCDMGIPNPPPPSN